MYFVERAQTLLFYNLGVRSDPWKLLNIKQRLSID